MSSTVVAVDVQIARAFDVHGRSFRPARDLVQHVVEKADAGVQAGLARAGRG
jgi:hypothetical protein